MSSAPTLESLPLAVQNELLGCLAKLHWYVSVLEAEFTGDKWMDT